MDYRSDLVLAGGCSLVVNCSISMYQALGSIPSTTTGNKTKQISALTHHKFCPIFTDYSTRTSPLKKVCKHHLDLLVIQGNWTTFKTCIYHSPTTRIKSQLQFYCWWNQQRNKNRIYLDKKDIHKLPMMSQKLKYLESWSFHMQTE